MFCISLSDGMQASKKVSVSLRKENMPPLSEGCKSKMSVSLKKEHLPEK